MAVPQQGLPNFIEVPLTAPEERKTPLPSSGFISSSEWMKNARKILGADEEEYQRMIEIVRKVESTLTADHYSHGS